MLNERRRENLKRALNPRTVCYVGGAFLENTIQYNRRLGFDGELRATGQVLCDQYLFMRRCGFDAFEVPAGTPVEAFRRAEATITRFYQPATDDATPIGTLRAGGAVRPRAARTAS